MLSCSYKRTLVSWTFIIMIAALPASLWGHGKPDHPQHPPHPCHPAHHCPTPTPTPAAPVFTSTAPAAAEEGRLYTYDIAATDPAGGAVTFGIVTAPPGAAISGSTLTWTPDHLHSRTANQFVISATSSGGTATQSFVVTPSGNIVGTAVDTFITKSGEVLRPNPMGSNPPVVYVADGQGGFTTITGSGNDQDGSFTVSGVPAGLFLLSSSYGFAGYPTPYVIHTSSSDLNLGQILPGRPDCVTAQYSGVPLATFEDALSSPNLANGFVTFYSGNSMYFNTSIGNVSADPFQAQQYFQFPCLVDSTQGDDAYLLHYLPSQSNPSVQTIVEAVGPLSMVQQNGSTVAITDPFHAVANNVSISPKVAISQFDDLLDQALPPSTASNPVTRGNRFAIVGQPYFPHIIFAGPDLFTYTGSEASDLDLGNVEFSNPLPDHMPYTMFERQGTISVTGPFYTTGFTGGVGLVQKFLPAAGTQIVPLMTPVRNPRIDGNDFFAVQPSLSMTPTLTWDPPAVGTPNHYIISIYGVSSTVPSVSNNFVHTNQTTVTIPPGIIQPGNTYVFIINAIADGMDFSSAPLWTMDDYSYAASLSAASEVPAPPVAATARAAKMRSAEEKTVRVVPGRGASQVTIR